MPLYYPPVPVSGLYEPNPPIQTTGSVLGNATMFMWPQRVTCAVTGSRVNHLVSMSVSSSSNSSHAGTISLSFGIYTLNASTLSLASSGSQTYNWTNTSNNSMASLSGLRALSIPVNCYMPPGDYYFAFWSRTTTANANWFTASNIYMSGASQQFFGTVGNASNSSNQFFPGYGVHSNASFSTAMPSSIHISNLKGGHAAGVNKIPYINIVNTTF